MTQAQVRRKCRAYAERFIDIQRDEFKRLGVMGEWDNPYLTMNYRYEATIAREVLQVRPGRQPVSQQEADPLVLQLQDRPCRSRDRIPR